MLRDPVDDEDERDHDRDEADHEPGEARHPLVEGGLDGFSRQTAGDGAEVRARAGLDDDGAGRAALHGRAEEAEVLELQRALIARVTGGLEFLDRERFAGEARLRDEEVPARQNADVGRYHVAGTELDHVAGDDAVQWFLERAACAQDGRRDPDHGPQLLGRRVGPRLLREAQPDAKDDHGAHDDGGAGIARRDGDAGEDGEEKNERVQARPREEPEAPVALVGGHDVRAVFRKAARRFVFRETLRRRAEPFQRGG